MWVKGWTIVSRWRARVAFGLRCDIAGGMVSLFRLERPFDHAGRGFAAVESPFALCRTIF